MYIMRSLFPSLFSCETYALLNFKENLIFFHHFVGLALKGLMGVQSSKGILKTTCIENFEEQVSKIICIYLAHFSAQAKKIKNAPRENVLYSNIKKVLIFSQKKAVLKLQEKKSICFRKGNFLIFQEELPKSKKPTFLVFLQKEL